MHRWLRWTAVLLALVAAGFLLWRFALRPDAVPVTVARVSRGLVEETVTNSKAGTVKARRRSKMSPEISGRVDFIGARAGERVRKGQILLRLNDADLVAGLRLSEQEVVVTRASAREACFAADLAERDLLRHRDLSKERIVSPEIVDRLESQRDAARARCESMRASVQRADAAVDLARANLGKTVLRAPFDGIVADLKGEIGEVVSPSPPAVPIPPVYDVIDPTSIYISAPLDEVDAGKVSPGLPARVTLDPYPGRSFAGSVIRVAPYVQDYEQQNRTLEIEVDLQDAEFSRGLLPGTSADVEVVLRRADDVLRVPSFALLEGDRVLVFNAGHLVARPVTVGLRNWEYAEVQEGVQEGDPVVVSLDRAEVKEGARARIDTEQPAAETR